MKSKRDNNFWRASLRLDETPLYSTC